MGIVKFFLEAVETLGFPQTASLIALGKKGIIHRFDTHGINTLPLKKFFEYGDYEALKMMFAGFEAVEYARIPPQKMNKTQKIGSMMFLASGFEDGDISWGGVVPSLIGEALRSADRDVRLWGLKALLAALRSGRVSEVKATMDLWGFKDVHEGSLSYLYMMGLVSLPGEWEEDLIHTPPFAIYALESGVKVDMRSVWEHIPQSERKDILMALGMALDGGTVRFYDTVYELINLGMSGSEEERRWAVRAMAAAVYKGEVDRDSLLSFIDTYYTDNADLFTLVWIGNMIFHGIRQGIISPDDVLSILVDMAGREPFSMELFEKVLDTLNLIMTGGKLERHHRPLVERVKKRAEKMLSEGGLSPDDISYWESVKSAAEGVLSAIDRGE